MDPSRIGRFDLAKRLRYQFLRPLAAPQYPLSPVLPVLLKILDRKTLTDFRNLLFDFIETGDPNERGLALKVIPHLPDPPSLFGRALIDDVFGKIDSHLYACNSLKENPDTELQIWFELLAGFPADLIAAQALRKLLASSTEHLEIMISEPMMTTMDDVCVKLLVEMQFTTLAHLLEQIDLIDTPLQANAKKILALILERSITYRKRAHLEVNVARKGRVSPIGPPLKIYRSLIKHVLGIEVFNKLAAM